MSNYNNTNSGCLFPVKEPKSSKSPKFTGKLNIDGSDYIVACWINNEISDDFTETETFLSIKLSYKDRTGSYVNVNARGKLKKNQEKVQSQPDLKGFITIDEETHDLVAWNRESSEGRSFFSLAVTLNKPNTSDVDEEAPDFDETMPF